MIDYSHPPCKGNHTKYSPKTNEIWQYDSYMALCRIWHEFFNRMQHTKTCLSSPQGQYWAGRTFPPNNPPPNMAAANFVRITNVSLMNAGMSNWINSYFFAKADDTRASSQLPNKFTRLPPLLLLYSSSRHLLQPHRCTKERVEFTLHIGSLYLSLKPKFKILVCYQSLIWTRKSGFKSMLRLTSVWNSGFKLGFRPKSETTLMRFVYRQQQNPN